MKKSVNVHMYNKYKNVKNFSYVGKDKRSVQNIRRRSTSCPLQTKRDCRDWFATIAVAQSGRR